MPLQRELALKQIEDVLNRWDRFRAKSQYEDCSDQSENEITEMIQVLSSAIERVKPGSRQLQVVDEAIKRYGPDNSYLLTMLPGMLRAIRSDLPAGYIDHRPEAERERPQSQPNQKRVFVVHGRNEMARRAIFSFLRSVNLDPVEWNQAVSFVGSGAPYIGDVLDAVFRETQAVLVLLTGDDLARLGTRFHITSDPDYESRLMPQARPNVLFEAGMAFGRNSERTILVALGNLRPFSDVAGRHLVNISNSAAHRQTLVDRLRNAGCDVQTANRTDWLHEGDFDTAVANEPDNVRHDWTFAHPAKYSGPVWIRITTRDECRLLPHDIIVRWGPWQYRGLLDFGQGNTVSLVHTKGDDGLSVRSIVIFRSLVSWNSGMEALLTDQRLKSIRTGLS